MSLSQQTAVSALRQDRDAIKKYNQFILMQESKLLSSNFIKERLIAAKYGNEPFCAYSVICKEIILINPQHSVSYTYVRLNILRACFFRF